jgi:hypothetical protein
MQHEEKLISLFCGTHRLEEMSTAAEELTHKQPDLVGPDAIFDKIKPLFPDFSRK